MPYSKIKKIRLGKYDRILSKICREKANYTCEFCGKYDERFTQAHHFVRRTAKSVRFAPENIIVLCSGCHTFNPKFSAHRTPEKFKRWFKKTYPERAKWVEREAKKNKSERQAIKEFIEKYDLTRNN